MHSLISQEVPGLILEVLLEVDALDEAVPQAALLGGQKILGLQAHEAALCALGHGRRGRLMLELLSQIVGDDLQVELLFHLYYKENIVLSINFKI